MIKSGDPFYCVERFVGMTLNTVLAELILVGIGMAVVAVLEPDPGKFLELQIVSCCDRMAFHAGNRLMHSCERISRVGMTEFDCRLECITRMAVGTGFGDRFLMIISMTGNAVGIQSKVCKLFVFNLSLGNTVFLVTISASLFCVGTCQFETGQIMIELILVETDNLEIDAMVIVVAGYAIFTPDFGRGVVPFFLVHPEPDLRVAFKTFCVGHLVAKRMTLCTVRNAFEM